MFCILIVIRYPKWLGWAGFLSMAIFRFPFIFNKNIYFKKLLGSGKNGTFDKHPDWHQWAILISIEKRVIDNWQFENDKRHISSDRVLLKNISTFIFKYLTFFRCKICTLILEPIEGVGKWDGKECFGKLPRTSNYEGQICVLTRATIHFNKLKSFWKNVPAIAAETIAAKGLKATIGIGEVPFIKQATFSIWESTEAMKQFAYNRKQHAEVIKKTREGRWYKEEMFVRFKLIKSYSSLKGKEYF